MISHIKSNTIADFTGTVTAHNSAGATLTVAATDLIRPSDWNSAHSQIVTLTGANTTVQSTAGGTNMVYSGAGNVTLGGSTGTLVISGPAWVTWDNTKFGHFGPAAQTSFSLGQNSLYIYPECLSAYVTGAAVRLPIMVTNSSSGAASVQRGHTLHMGVYTAHATNSTVLTLHYSTSYTMAASHNSNASWMLSIITAINNSTSYLSTTTSSAGINLSSLLHGPRELILPFSSMLSPGEYWFALRQSSSSAGAAGNVLQFSHLGAALQTFNRVGIATNSSNSAYHKEVGLGVFSTTTNGMPNGISLTDINLAGSIPIIYWANRTV